MKVTVGGHTRTGRVVHAIFGQWSYSGGNTSWCGVELSGNDHRMNGDVEVTCKRCVKVTPKFTPKERDIAFEVSQAYRAGFDHPSNPAWVMRTRALFDAVPGWKGSAAWVAGIILSTGK